MNLSLNDARQILADLGYRVHQHDSMLEGRIYFVVRCELAEDFNLPKGDWFDLAGIKAFCFKAARVAASHGLILHG